MAAPIYQYHIKNMSLALKEGNIMHVIAKGDVDNETADRVYEISMKIQSKLQGAIHSVVDLNQAGKSTPHARKVWKKLSADGRSGKVALFGLSPVARVLASFVIGRTGKDNVRFFKTKEEALAWVKA